MTRFIYITIYIYRYIYIMNVCISFTLGDLATSVPLMEAIMHDKVYIYIYRYRYER